MVRGGEPIEGLQREVGQRGKADRGKSGAGGRPPEHEPRAPAHRAVQRARNAKA